MEQLNGYLKDQLVLSLLLFAVGVLFPVGLVAGAPVGSPTGATSAALGRANSRAPKRASSGIESEAPTGTSSGGTLRLCAGSGPALFPLCVHSLALIRIGGQAEVTDFMN